MSDLTLTPSSRMWSPSSEITAASDHPRIPLLYWKNSPHPSPWLPCSPFPTALPYQHHKKSRDFTSSLNMTFSPILKAIPWLRSKKEELASLQFPVLEPSYCSANSPPYLSLSTMIPPPFKTLPLMTTCEGTLLPAQPHGLYLLYSILRYFSIWFTTSV